MKVYTFQIQDKDPECLTFGCLAETPFEARQKLNKAGYTQALILEARDLVGVELDEVVDLEVLANPFLGPDWLPIIDTLAPYIKRDGVGKSWSLDVATSPYNWGHNEPGGEVHFLQAMNEADGTLHLELGTSDLIRSGATKELHFLSFSGWNEPQDGLPIHFRAFEPGWNPRHALYVAFQAMTHVLNVTAHDIFMPQGVAFSAFIDSDQFDFGKWNGPFQLERTAFAYKGLHELSDTEPSQEIKDKVLARAFPKNET